MKKLKLLPFSLVLTGSYRQQTDQFPEELKRRAHSLAAKMDIATNPVFKAFLAGSFSGTCSTVLFQPLDLVKTRIQQQASAAGGSTGYPVAAAGGSTGYPVAGAIRPPAAAAATTLSAAAQPIGGQVTVAAAAANPASGMITVARQVLQTDNVIGLWRGILPSVTRTVPGVGIYFASLHWLKNSSLGGVQAGEKPSPLQAVCLGMGARSLAATIMIPITVLKTRFESGQFGYTRMSTALISIYRTEGVKGLTCGLLPTLVRDAPYSGLYLMFYTQLKDKFVPRVDRATGLALSGGTLTHFACGLGAGFMASLATHPADVIKTKMQLQPALHSSIAGTIRMVLAKSGPRGLLIGFAPRMLRRALMSALAWTVYEEIMKQIGLK